MAKETSSYVEFAEKFLEDQKDDNDELLFSFRGVLYPSRLCKAETFKALETMEARKDDVLIVAYPKCGTNWSQYIVNNMVAEIYKDCPPPNNFQLLEFGHPEKIKDINEWPSPRVFTTHLHYDNIPKSFFENKVKIVVIFRNPKDTALKENLYEGIKQIAEFYAFPLSEEKIKSLASKATFQGMSDRSSETHGSIAPIIFRKGEVGDWKTLFTEAQSQEMDAKFEEC
uniref:Sulfotransferase n=1 Tax=Anolis carolinensis TaxID=28377 RepID=A0A803THK5_ANOCA